MLALKLFSSETLGAWGLPVLLIRFGDDGEGVEQMMDSRLRQGDVIHEQSSNNAAGATVKSTGHPSRRSDLAVRDREGIP